MASSNDGCLLKTRSPKSQQYPAAAQAAAQSQDAKGVRYTAKAKGIQLTSRCEDFRFPTLSQASENQVPDFVRETEGSSRQQFEVAGQPFLTLPAGNTPTRAASRSELSPEAAPPSSTDLAPCHRLHIRPVRGGHGCRRA